MIRFLRGTIYETEDSDVILDVGGVGYRVWVSGMTLAHLPEAGLETTLYTYMQVREDGVSLFGFSEKEELDMFERLIGISGIGPKAALGILSTLSVNDLVFAIMSDDAKAISAAPGIGPKTARRVVLELKDKVSLEEAFEERSSKNQSVAAKAGNSGEVSAAVQGLVALGYGASEAMKAVKAVPQCEDKTAEQLLGEALLLL